MPPVKQRDHLASLVPHGIPSSKSHRKKKRHAVYGKRFVFVFGAGFLLILATLFAGFFYYRIPRGEILNELSDGRGNRLRIRKGHQKTKFLTSESKDGSLRWKVALFNVQEGARMAIIGKLVRVRSLDPYGVPESVAYHLDDGAYAWRLEGPRPKDPDSLDSKEQQGLAKRWSQHTWGGPDVICLSEECCVEVYSANDTRLIYFDPLSGRERRRDVITGPLRQVQGTEIVTEQKSQQLLPSDCGN